jgi:hypothetical protein
MKLVALTVGLNVMLKIDDGCNLSKRQKLEVGRRRVYLSERWNWRDKDNRNGRRAKRRLEERFLRVMVSMVLEVALGVNGMSINGLGTLEAIARIGGHRVLEAEGDRLLVRDHRLLGDDYGKEADCVIAFE